MSCPNNIKVRVSTRFFMFPYAYVTPQTDVGGAPVANLIIYVPTDEDIQYVDKTKLGTFKSVRVLRHETTETETRLVKKNPTATIVYWNPILPIDNVGVGETRVFSVMLTNDLFFCKTMILDHNNAVCPIEFYSRINYKKLMPIEGEQPLFYLNKLLDKKCNNFLICFKLETPTMVKIMNIKKILSIFEYRDEPARYAIYLPDSEIDTIYNKLTWERVRRLIKGDVNVKCSHVNRHSLQYLKLAMDIMGVDNNTKVVSDLVFMFQPLIVTYQLVPDVIVKLNTLEKQKRVRLYCNHDSFAVTTYGMVPVNMPDDNPVAYDYADTLNNKYMYETTARIVKESNINSIKIHAAKYNYFF
ncbi:ODV-ec43 [Euproctis pseudoconspersa nucleopolyhedrovirus]|uniref:ODV-ec43 n=1 Tax=Euproctis pseudoconspersa nucleopolyhedrovirus TaxID=307467 RepID=C3TX01_9ABAC|nr:ODV-ec43 [Euproctis pseudoconspersa nucleopolyhedrovirus]ACO53543.1 ODV-ec43 [Euproctis pseudoconspersa nucleopolyhedrovirus]QUJ09283.1 ODV-ec43 protein [Gynaephora ruoergensis nucleopolyhedrovirus]